MIGVPPTTPYDLHFRLLGVPVRVHPFFWLFSAVLGWGSPREVLVWVSCVFLSIMVHEFGHALTNRLFGVWPFVVLYTFGGLCVAEDGRTLRPWQRFLVIAAGPGAGLTLFAITFVTAAFLSSSGRLSEVGQLFVWDLIQINLFWSLLNLLPIFPLDGGQLTGILLSWRSPSHGREHTYILSAIAGAGAALLMAKWGSYFACAMFAYLAIQNFQSLQASRSGYL